MASSKCFVFIFPNAAGHVNPSLPVSRRLVQRGHRVHYLSFTPLQTVIEDTGATFHNVEEVESELYNGRKPDAFGAMMALCQEHGVAADIHLGRVLVANVQAELQLKGLLRFLPGLAPDAIIFCPIFNREAFMVAKILKIPAIGILTVAGPGCLEEVIAKRNAECGYTLEKMQSIVAGFQAGVDATERLCEQYDLDLPVGPATPMGILDSITEAALTLVTTCEELQDPCSDTLRAAYEAKKAQIAFVGPILDVSGASRASHSPEAGAGTDHQVTDDELTLAIREAKQAGRQVILVSMGTVLTGDTPVVGWNARMPGPDGQPQGLTGKQLCQAAWAGAFDAFGTKSASEGPLIVMSIGMQKDALDGIEKPPNAICVPFFPQVDVLREGPAVFLTHGGQNSFTEGLACCVPLVVCPGFGDQVVNSEKAQTLGFGLKVARPKPEQGDELEAAKAYRQEVCKALRTVVEDKSFKQTAEHYAKILDPAKGVLRATELILKATCEPAAEGQKTAPAVDFAALYPQKAGA